VSALWPLEARGYVPHALHRGERAWTETNCYVDLWIELMHALKLDPVAALAFTAAADDEGDQWTFFKYPLEDLRALYGLEVHELNIWRSLPRHIDEQLQQGRPVIVEVDSFYLPDTAGVSYQIDHTKSSVAVQAIDLEKRTLGYFHNAGYYELGPPEYDGIFQGGGVSGAVRLAPYVEVVKLHALERPEEGELKKRALALLAHHLQRRPRQNPIGKYRARLESDLAWLKTEPLSMFHLYAFATLRQLGANYELLAAFLRWLEARGESALPIAAFEEISGTAKTLMLKMARAVNSKKPAELGPMFLSMEEAWQRGIDALLSRYGN